MHRPGDRRGAARGARGHRVAAGRARALRRDARHGDRPRDRHRAPHGGLGPRRRHAPVLLPRGPRHRADEGPQRRPEDGRCGLPRAERAAGVVAAQPLFAALGHDEDFVSTVAAAPFPIEGGDVFLLCTDGSWEYIDEAAMAEALAAPVRRGVASAHGAGRRQAGREGQDNFRRSPSGAPKPRRRLRDDPNACGRGQRE